MALHSQTKKKRLCLDQSRYINKIFALKKKFIIESTEVFKEVVGKEWWMICFDLKAAYHHIEISEEDHKYFGFAAVIKGVERFFSFACLPFGFYVSAQVITKVLRHVIEKWRQERKTSFIHIDDGIIAFETEEEAKAGANEVQEDLEKFGLVISPD